MQDKIEGRGTLIVEGSGRDNKNSKLTTPQMDGIRSTLAGMRRSLV